MTDQHNPKPEANGLQKVLSMNKKILLGALCLSAAIFSGCSFAPKVPSTEIAGKLGGVSFAFKSPKDTTASGLAITVNTNGSATLTVAQFSTILNPTNIIATGNASAQLADSVGTAVVNGINASANAVGVIGAAAAKAAVKP